MFIKSKRSSIRIQKCIDEFLFFLIFFEFEIFWCLVNGRLWSVAIAEDIECQMMYRHMPIIWFSQATFYCHSKMWLVLRGKTRLQKKHPTSTDTNIDIGYKCNYFFQPISRRTCHTHRILCPQSSTTTIPTSQDQSNARLIFGKVNGLKRSRVAIFHNFTKLKSIIQSVM